MSILLYAIFQIKLLHTALEDKRQRSCLVSVSHYLAIKDRRPTVLELIKRFVQFADFTFYDWQAPLSA